MTNPFAAFRPPALPPAAARERRLTGRLNRLGHPGGPARGLLAVPAGRAALCIKLWSTCEEKLRACAQAENIWGFRRCIFG